MSKIKLYFLQVLKVPYMKYIAVTVFGLLFVGVIGENSIWAHLRHLQYIGQLEDEIADYNARNERDCEQIRKLDTNPKAIEKIARERYFMKADDEEIFVLSTDERHTNTLLPDSNATVE